MSSINRLLSRRDKYTHQKVMSSPVPTPPHVSDSSSISSSTTSTSTSPPVQFALSHGQKFSSSLSSLSLAFTTQTPKRSPSLQAIEGTIHASTANAFEHLLLQPKQTAGHLHGLFPDEETEAPVKDDETKIRLLSQRLARAGYTNLKEPEISFVLHTPYAKGDPEKAYDILVLLEESESGIIKDYDPNIKLLGAVNREGVSCYLDSVLFAMFARLGSFEAILYHNFQDGPKKRLATLLRLWVNTLRVGKLITTDITKQIQLLLADCGWKEAASLDQQDASEAFSFITETLELPLLTLKMDIFHQGKEEVSDDHKFINERLLEVAVPEDSRDGRPITLEECLENYFNNRIEVKRYLERRNTLNSTLSRPSFSSFKGQASHIETVEVKDAQTPTAFKKGLFSFTTQNSPSKPINSRSKATGIVREFFVSEKSEVPESASSIEEEYDYPGRRRATSLRKEIMLPAWQFFNLIPWYTDNSASNDAQVASHFASIRPVLGICLKRYSVLPNGQPSRRDTHIDIPIDIGLPHFIQDDAMSEDGDTFGNFKLSLQSAVCHRGKSVDSGHYVSLVRTQEPARDLLSGSSSGVSSDGPPREGWMRLDDLAPERVAFVDVEEFLRTESPYLLFYQVQPIDEDPMNVVNTWRPPSFEGPPSYAESENRDSAINDLSLSVHNSLETKGTLAPSNGPVAGGTTPQQPSGRTSIIVERPKSTLTADSAAETNTTNSPSNLSIKASTTDPKYLTASGDSRGRPMGPGSDKRLSRSLSRLRGKLKKDKNDESPAIISDAVSELGSQVSKPPTTEVFHSNDHTQGKKGSKDKRKHKNPHSGNNGLDGHQLLMKSKKKPDKPGRECLIM